MTPIYTEPNTNTKVYYTTCPERMSRILTHLSKNMYPKKNKLDVSFDTETTGLNCRTDRVFMLQFLFNDRDNIGNKVVIIYEDEYFNTDIKLHNKNMSKVMSCFLKEYRECKYLIGHNLPFDYKMVQKYEDWRKHRLDFKMHCTMKTEQLIQAGSTGFVKYHTLSNLAKKYEVLNKSDKVMEYIKEHKLYEKKQILKGREKYIGARFYDVPRDILIPYGAIDTIAAYLIFLKQLKFRR